MYNLDLAKEVYDVLVEQGDLEEVGITGFLLLGALLNEKVFYIDEDDESLALLKTNFEDSHELWDHIREQ